MPVRERPLDQGFFPGTGVDLDDLQRMQLEGAATPIEVEPMAGEAGPVEDPWRAALRQAGWEDKYIDLIMQTESRPHPSVFTQPYWQEREARRAREIKTREARQDQFAQDYNAALGEPHNPPPPFSGPVQRDGGLPNFQPGATAMVDGVEVPAVDLGDGSLRWREGDRRAALAERADGMRRAGGPRGVPGPRTADGRPVTPPPEFQTVKEAEDYWTRPTDEDGNLLPSPGDLAMEQRARVPVYAFQDTNPPMPGGGERLPGEMAPGDVGYTLGWRQGDNAPNRQAELERKYYTSRQMMQPLRDEKGSIVMEGGKPVMVPGDQMWTTETKEGPTGTFDVLVPTPALRARQAQQSDDASIRRISTKTGLPYATVAAMTPDQRAKVYLRSEAQKTVDRRQRVADIHQLAGGAQNVNSGNRMFLNALMMLQPDERAETLREMMPMNPNRAYVQAQNMENARAIVQAAMTAQGGNWMQQDPIVQRTRELELRAAEAAARQADPVKAGQDDLRAGNTASPEAHAELKRLAEQFDTGGLWYMSPEDEDRLAAHLMQMGIDENRARDLARRAADQHQRMNPALRRTALGVIPGFFDLLNMSSQTAAGERPRTDDPWTRDLFPQR